MAYLAISDNYVAVAWSSIITVIDLKTKETVKELSSETATSEKDGKKNESFQTLCCAISNKFVAVGTNRKRLIIWNTDSWDSPFIVSFSKPATAVKLVDLGETQVTLVADRSGSVVSIPCKPGSIPAEGRYLLGSAEDESSDDSDDGESNGSKPLSNEETGQKERVKPVTVLGHCSMLLDLAVSSDGKYVVTSDRDEKIRVSNFPKLYNVESMCVGHKEYVRSVTFFRGSEGRQYLISASGDGFLKFWNYNTGECIHTQEIVTRKPSADDDYSEKNGAEKEKSVNSLIGQIRKITCSSRDNTVAISFEESPKIVELHRICISETEQSNLLLSVTRLQILEFDRSIWDIGFDSDSKLWILCYEDEAIRENDKTADIRSPLSVWQWDTGSSKIVLEKEVELSEKALEALKVAKDALPLHPKRPDYGNYEKYQERKKEKMEKFATKRRKVC